MKSRFFIDFPLLRISQVLSRFCLVLQPQKVLCRCVQNIPVQMSTIQNSDDDVWVRRGSHCNIFPRRYTCQHMWKNPIFPWFHDNPVFDLCVGGGVLAAGLRNSPNHSQLLSRHNQLQSAYLNAVRNCVHMKMWSASAKFQIARDVHVCTTLPATVTETRENPENL